MSFGNKQRPVTKAEAVERLEGIIFDALSADTRDAWRVSPDLAKHLHAAGYRYRAKQSSGAE